MRVSCCLTLFAKLTLAGKTKARRTSSNQTAHSYPSRLKKLALVVPVVHWNSFVHLGRHCPRRHSLPVAERPRPALYLGHLSFLCMFSRHLAQQHACQACRRPSPDDT